MERAVTTNILVPGRGHDVLADGSLQLSDSAEARLDTAVGYYHINAEAFQEAESTGNGSRIVMSGGYARLATAGAITAPPYEQRESTLMFGRALLAGVPEKFLANSPASDSSLENVLRPYEEGHFTTVNPDNPLGIITQVSQWERLEWFARRVFQLPKGAVVLIEAPGEDDPAILREERKLLRITQVLYGPARSPAGLRRAERLAGAASRLAVRTGLQQAPAASYLNAA